MCHHTTKIRKATLRDSQIMVMFWKTLLCQLVINVSQHAVKGSLCLGGEDIFAAVRENSPNGEFIANLSIAGDPRSNGIRLCLTGDDADWFYLEGKTIRLNTSFSRTLDREVHGSVLMAVLTCYDGGTVQSEYRIMAEILNENDNRPVFVEETIQPVTISELAAVNSVAFVVRAVDADDDTIIYVIDKSLPDSSYFRIDLPNSGGVILSKPLDYETKTQMQLAIYAVEMNTQEKYNTSAVIMIDVQDGDDQYPQFQPCIFLTQGSMHGICTSPVYTVNVTEADKNITLNFSPGPIHAVDGDKDIDTPLVYAILSGADNGRFHIDNQSGEVTMSSPVENTLLSPTLKLQIMASQVDDPKKYTIATALVHVLAQNLFPPQFTSSTYAGFVMESDGSSLVSTYANQALVLQAVDRDFKDGINPKIRYSLRTKSNITRLYHVTQEGHLIAKGNQLRAFEKHSIEVIATDQESGEVAEASVNIVVLQRGEQAPRSPFGGQKHDSLDAEVVLAGGVMLVVLLLLVTAMPMLLRLARQRRQRQDPASRASVAQGKHPNVVNSGRSKPLIEEISYRNEAYIDCDSTNLAEESRDGAYTKEPGILCRNSQRRNDSSNHLNDSLSTPDPILSNGKTTHKSSKSVTFEDDVLLKGMEMARNARFRSIQVQTEERAPVSSESSEIPQMIVSVPEETVESKVDDQAEGEKDIKNPYESVCRAICE